MFEYNVRKEISSDSKIVIIYICYILNNNSKKKISTDLLLQNSIFASSKLKTRVFKLQLKMPVKEINKN